MFNIKTGDIGYFFTNPQYRRPHRGWYPSGNMLIRLRVNGIHRRFWIREEEGYDLSRNATRVLDRALPRVGDALVAEENRTGTLILIVRDLAGVRPFFVGGSFYRHLRPGGKRSESFYTNASTRSMPAMPNTSASVTEFPADRFSRNFDLFSTGQGGVLTHPAAGGVH